MSIETKLDLEYLVSCLCCQARHYNIASATHSLDTLKQVIEFRDYLRQHNMPSNLERFFNTVIERREKNERHDSTN